MGHQFSVISTCFKTKGWSSGMAFSPDFPTAWCGQTNPDKTS